MQLKCFMEEKTKEDFCLEPLCSSQWLSWLVLLFRSKNVLGGTFLYQVEKISKCMYDGTWTWIHSVRIRTLQHWLQSYHCTVVFCCFCCNCSCLDRLPQSVTWKEYNGFMPNAFSYTTWAQIYDLRFRRQWHWPPSFHCPLPCLVLKYLYICILLSGRHKSAKLQFR